MRLHARRAACRLGGIGAAVVLSVAGHAARVGATDGGARGAPATEGGAPDPVATEDAAPGAGATEGGTFPASSTSASFATMKCARVSAAPARVRCAVEARVGNGEAITWGDATLVTLPPFVAALRGRMGPREAVERDVTNWRWELGLVARANGEGSVGGRARLVVCKKGVCEPRVLAFQGHVAVGD